MGIAERKEREKLQRRNDIIDAAEKIFFGEGFEHATMERVAEKAELSKGTLYLYFTSREDLQFAVFMRGSDILMKMMKDGLAVDRTGYEGLLALAGSFIRFSREQPDYFALFMYYESSHLNQLNISAEQLEHYLREQSPLAMVLEEVKKGMYDGSLRSDLNPDVFSATLWSQMLGVLVVLNNKADLYEIFNLRADEILQTHMELVSHGSVPKEQ